MEPDSEAPRTWRLARLGGRGAVALLSAAVLATTGYGWSVYQSLNSRITTTTALPAPPTTQATPAPGLEAPFTALIVGVDSRTDAAGEPLPSDILDQLHAGADEGERNTDTIILLHVPAGLNARAVAISFPRDSFVRIAGGRGTHKINSAYARGMNDSDPTISAVDHTAAEQDRLRHDAGRQALIATVQELADVQIDHFAEINLAGFVEITDALGGVPVCLNSAVREPLSGIDLPAGRQVVRGADALAFVRQRHGLDDGDLGRINRQQAFLAGLTSSALSTGALADPRRVDRLVRAVSRYVVLDQGWDLRQLVGQLRRIAGGDITFQTIPTGSAALRTPGDGVALAVDPAEVRRFVRALVDGQPPDTAVTPSAGRSSGAPATPTPSPGSPPNPGLVSGMGVPSPGPSADAIGSPTSTVPSPPPATPPPTTSPSATSPSATPSARAAAASKSTTSRTRGATRKSSASTPASSTSATSSATVSATPTTAPAPPPITAGGVPCVD